MISFKVEKIQTTNKLLHPNEPFSFWIINQNQITKLPKFLLSEFPWFSRHNDRHKGIIFQGFQDSSQKYIVFLLNKKNPTNNLNLKFKEIPTSISIFLKNQIHDEKPYRQNVFLKRILKHF